MPLLPEDSYFSIRNAGKQSVSTLIKCRAWFMSEVTFNYFGGFLANFVMSSMYNLQLQLVLMEPSFWMLEAVFSVTSKCLKRNHILVLYFFCVNFLNAMKDVAVHTIYLQVFLLVIFFKPRIISVSFLSFWHSPQHCHCSTVTRLFSSYM